MKKILSLAVFILCLSVTLHAQTGSISGRIMDGTTKTPLPGASVVIDGTTQGAMTDLDGIFKITAVQPGKVNLKISYVGYVTQLLSGVEVTSGNDTKIELKLVENVSQLQGADVVAQRSTHTENAVLMEVKQSEQIISGVSSQQIGRSQDRTAGEVIRRVPGVTLMDNGFVLIRGLNERYNTVLLNGIIAPSMEADKKAFALDVIPAGMLDRLMVYKTGSPELPGEFAGGVIKVVTKKCF
jgi:hypothetical protein